MAHKTSLLSTMRALKKFYRNSKRIFKRLLPLKYPWLQGLVAMSRNSLS